MKQVTLRLDDELAARIDEARGLVPREPFIRLVLGQHVGLDRTSDMTTSDIPSEPSAPMPAEAAS